ncbi:hypothetical protein Pcinc_037979 [Petrolisthes cinctipes]|uniref:Condensation domain-containing protein n=1 Tax=Petrolisthes cinctipes TaxID=88211 RepID=A0AAE1BSG7_PETCI|nr:hypothetical protein Pcinc_037979 [Petrolisthes cinctipes]
MAMDSCISRNIDIFLHINSSCPLSDQHLLPLHHHQASTLELGEGGYGSYTVVVTACLVIVGMAWLLRQLEYNVDEGKSQELREYETTGDSSSAAEGQWALPGKWVRPLNSMELLYAVGRVNTAQVLYLESTSPVTVQLVQRALTILAENVLLLQLEMVWRWWWPWFRRTKAVTVHLSQSTEEPMAVYQKQMNSEYDTSNGPLWHATLVHPQHSSQESVLVLTIHHMIGDGTTNMLLSRDLLTIINGLATGQKNHIPCRDLVPPVFQSLFSLSDALTVFTLFFWGCRNNILRSLQGGAAYLLPSPNPSPSITKAITHDFSREVTAQLNSRCKEEDVRISSVLLAASIFAYTHTVQEEGKCTKQMEVTHETAVNLRRYYSDRHQEAVGSVAFTMSLKHNVTHDSNFWALARRIQQDLYKALDEDKLPLHFSQLGCLLSFIFPINWVLEWCGLRSFAYSQIFLTNMGNLRTLLPATYHGPIRITRLLRSFSAHYLGICFGVVTQTFDGRLLISIDHYSNKTTDETATCFLRNLVQILTDIASNSTPSPFHLIKPHVPLSNS